MASVHLDEVSVQFASPQHIEPLMALSGVSLSVEQGEFLAVVGPSGCGKTTLLRVIGGLERPSQGAVRLTQSDPRRPAYGMVFQDGGLFPWMSVLENIAYGLRMRGQRGKKRYERALYWMGRVGLSRFADAFPHQLSGGMRQRVGLARAFALNPEVLLMDEPFAALDAQNRLLLQETLLELWQETDSTVIFVTHSIEEALTLSDRVVMLSARPGRLLKEMAVHFPRPRDSMSVRLHPDFATYTAAIWDVLGQEVKASAGGLNA
jgi:NitT/TauT family transport system ATP-binding protein